MPRSKSKQKHRRAILKKARKGYAARQKQRVIDIKAQSVSAISETAQAKRATVTRKSAQA
ncbi:MAG: hypothetical protein OEM52_00170 [bacterium]|nr:hypothetical protein [bacterium]